MDGGGFYLRVFHGGHGFQEQGDGSDDQSGDADDEVVGDDVARRYVEYAFDEWYGGEEGPDGFPLVSEEEVYRSQARSRDRERVAKIADHWG